MSFAKAKVPIGQLAFEREWDVLVVHAGANFGCEHCVRFSTHLVHHTEQTWLALSLV